MSILEKYLRVILYRWDGAALGCQGLLGDGEIFWQGKSRGDHPEDGRPAKKRNECKKWPIAFGDSE
jgi:hypothetical protein